MPARRSLNSFEEENAELIQQGSPHSQPKQCIVIRETPQNYHGFLLFDSPSRGNLMTPVYHRAGAKHAL